MSDNQDWKAVLVGVAITLVVAVYAFHSFTATINETGFLGMDKNGRQILIQTLDHYATEMSSSVRIDSDWDDYSFIERLWQEPMRTTLRLYKAMDEVEYKKMRIGESLALIDPVKDIEDTLYVPYRDFLSAYESEISMNEEYSISIKELKERADEAGVVTYRDLLRGFGFTEYEYYVNDELVASITLNPNVTNHTKGKFTSTVGSTRNET